jgi:hypothetical protein
MKQERRMPLASLPVEGCRVERVKGFEVATMKRRKAAAIEP